MHSEEAKKFDWTTVGLDFGNWSDEKLWALDLPTTEIKIDKLSWLLDVPFLPNDAGEKFTCTPREVLNRAIGTTQEQKRVLNSDLQYPIDIIENKGQFLILDGLHRLIKAISLGQTVVKVRVVPREQLPQILIEEPIELPN
jgi:hypothetical protein